MGSPADKTERPGYSKDSTDRWQSFYEEYLAGDSVTKWHKWCLLTKQDQAYFLSRFHLEPPAPAREKKVILIAVSVSFCLIVFSFYYGYFNVIPISIGFLSSSGFIPEDVGLLLNYGKNIFVIFQFLMITVILFQLPIILEILMIMNVLSRKTLLKASRFIVIGIFVLSAIVTPPDFVSQISIALPLIGLFFLTILIARIFNFGKGQP